MFCPSCRAEFRPGFTMCSDCHIPLVGQLPQEPEEPHADEDEYVRFKPILSTFNNGDIALIRSLLENEGIRHFFQGENFHYIRPAVEPAILMVDENRIEEVRELLKDLKLRYIVFGTIG